ncbi:MAG: hypothetical protein ACR2KL_12660 [Nocardioidaceae bacterium]
MSASPSPEAAPVTSARSSTRNVIGWLPSARGACSTFSETAAPGEG